MMIPDSLQTLGNNVFHRCSKLVPSYIDVDYDTEDEEDEYENGFRIDSTPQVVAHLLYVQPEFLLAEKDSENIALKRQSQL